MTLRVRLSIVPFGDESQEREIEVINISNIGKVDDVFYRYVVELGKDNYKQYTDVTPTVVHERNAGPITLVRRAIQHGLGL